MPLFLIYSFLTLLRYWARSLILSSSLYLLSAFIVTVISGMDLSYSCLAPTLSILENPNSSWREALRHASASFIKATKPNST